LGKEKRCPEKKVNGKVAVLKTQAFQHECGPFFYRT
jgi:hypothetical protein